MRLSRTALLTRADPAATPVAARTRGCRHPRRARAEAAAAASRASQCHPFLPDRYLAITLLFVSGEAMPRRDFEHERKQLVRKLVECGRAIEQRAGIEVDPVRLLRGDVAVRRDLDRGRGKA